MISLNDFKQQFIDRTHRTLTSYLPTTATNPERLHQAMHYAALNPGKRIRPLLVYATGHMLDVDNNDLDAPAAAVELIHAYSLVHDDLPCMDDDDLRRGRPTCHIQFDEATAVLTGDALQTLAFQVLVDAPFSQKAQTNQIKMLSLLSRASGSLGMGGGQAIDLESTGQSLTLEALEQMHRMKTGALINVSVLLGYLASGKSNAQEMAHLSRYADAIGLAFQIKDDILDIESDTETLGKPQGSDLESDKVTYPALLGLEGAKQHAQNQFEEALQALSNLPYNTELLRQFAQHIIERDR